MTLRFLGRSIGASLVALVLVCSDAGAQSKAAPASAAAAQPEIEKDALGRSTPRGTVLGFLTAARRGDDAQARTYLNTTSQNSATAEDLAHELYVVLDARLPARLADISDEPEGSRANLLAPNEERIGTIDGPSGPFDVVIERVTRPKSDPIWLFSKDTLRAIPPTYDAIVNQKAAQWIPKFLIDHRLGGVRLYEWVLLVLGIPAIYLLTVLLNRAVTPVIAFVGKHLWSRVDGTIRNVVPAPGRLLILSLLARWLISSLPLSLLVREFLTSAAAVVTIVAVTWLVVLVDGEVERAVRGRIPSANFAAASSLLRVCRRLVDIVVVVAGLLAMLRLFGVDPTPLLAGLGVGGIAVALAAQKTLENIIAGASLIIDQAVLVGDSLKVGDIQGTVDHIGLRSTRIRTLDRTVVSVPNGQIANMSLERLSARDMFWFHPMVGLSYDTTPDQMRTVLDGIRAMLEAHPAIDAGSVRVRFIRLGAFSLDVEVFAYLHASDWAPFLELQEGLLLRITEIVQAAGTTIAFPTQTMHMQAAPPAAGPEGPAPA